MPPPVLQPTLRQSVLPRPIPARFAQQRIETYLSDTESEAGHSGIISLYNVRALKNVLTLIFFQKSVTKAQPYQKSTV
jgi:hypothetical protein